MSFAAVSGSGLHAIMFMCLSFKGGRFHHSNCWNLSFLSDLQNSRKKLGTATNRTFLTFPSLCCRVPLPDAFVSRCCAVSWASWGVGGKPPLKKNPGLQKVSLFVQKKGWWTMLQQLAGRRKKKDPGHSDRRQKHGPLGFRTLYR